MINLQDDTFFKDSCTNYTFLSNREGNASSPFSPTIVSGLLFFANRMSSLCCLFCISINNVESFMTWGQTGFLFSKMLFHVFCLLFFWIITFSYWFLNFLYSLNNNLPLVTCCEHILTICDFSLFSRHLFIHKNSYF